MRRDPIVATSTPGRIGRVSERSGVARTGSMVHTALPPLEPVRTRRPVVLHVSEAFGGGVVSAIAALTAATGNEIEHHLLFRERKQHRIGQTFGRCVRTTTVVEGSLWNLYRGLDRLVRDVRPDIVHLHSTLAGVLGRLQSCRGVPVVYSPHCFSFENAQYGRLARGAFRLVENALSLRACTFACIGSYEQALAGRLWGQRPTFRIVNAVDPVLPGERRRPRGGPTRVVTVGRADAQKGVEMFAAIAQQLTGAGFEFRWIGGANAQGESLLARHGVAVSGWLPRDVALAELHDADLYLHTASWEGTPIAVLEAASIGLPILLRDIPHVTDIPTRFRFSTVKDAVDLLRSAGSPDVAAAMLEASASIVATFSPAELRRSVLACYRAILGSPQAVLADAPRADRAA